MFVVTFSLSTEFITYDYLNYTYGIINHRLTIK